MKYEAVFGDQSLFDGVLDNAIIVIKNNNSKYVITEHESSDIFQLTLCQPNSYLAMRRIISEPKRWTVADQKAGRLPEVGCSVLFTHNNFKCEVIAIDDSVTEDVELALRFSDGSILVCKINKIKPIESPEEKAALLCNEWRKTAADIFVRHPSCSATESLGGIYKAMLSGDLPVPVKE